jgi:hypothetical protein
MKPACSAGIDGVFESSPTAEDPLTTSDRWVLFKVFMLSA